jgi:5,10-methenyltetrahydrofolate synthetase
MAHEINPGYSDPLGTAAEQARDVARWRKAERARLLAARKALGVEGLRMASATLLRQMRAALDAALGGAQTGTVSFYWPIRSEPDLRPLMHDLVGSGLRVALPLVEIRKAPLVFREWTPDTRMIRGDWNIPVPPPDAPVITPVIAIAPLVGWDNAGYRLGYGGGYFDRTLATLVPRPFTIGVGFMSARLDTIYPQPHDIAMDMVVTEAGQQQIRRK